MQELSKIFQSADWKKEKHVPVIEAADKVRKGENVGVTLSVGKEIPHPNTTEHHIAWMDIYFQPSEGKFPYHIGRFEFSSHGASTDGPNTSTIFTHPTVSVTFKAEKSGTLFALSYCNIHGLWINSHEITIE
ncbi:MAG: class II SORL domain-containing protein [candidate division WOR-3 bacterium]|nr:MAG: class II SORL domain-containing protein [candidate division WOR-3 bacterium]